MSDVAQERLFEAVEVLIGPDPLEDRLQWAKRVIAKLHKQRGLPLPLAARVKNLADGFRDVPIKEMTGRQKQLFAGEILSLFEESMRRG